MADERLTTRYVEALLYFHSDTSDAARALYPDRTEYGFCRSYVAWSYSDRSKGWTNAEHRDAYEAARKARDDVREMGVSPV